MRHPVLLAVILVLAGSSAENTVVNPPPPPSSSGPVTTLAIQAGDNQLGEPGRALPTNICAFVDTLTA